MNVEFIGKVRAGCRDFKVTSTEIVSREAMVLDEVILGKLYSWRMRSITVPGICHLFRR